MDEGLFLPILPMAFFNSIAERPKYLLRPASGHGLTTNHFDINLWWRITNQVLINLSRPILFVQYACIAAEIKIKIGISRYQMKVKAIDLNLMTSSTIRSLSSNRLPSIPWLFFSLKSFTTSVHASMNSRIARDDVKIPNQMRNDRPTNEYDKNVKCQRILSSRLNRTKINKFDVCLFPFAGCRILMNCVRRIFIYRWCISSPIPGSCLILPINKLKDQLMLIIKSSILNRVCRHVIGIEIRTNSIITTIIMTHEKQNENIDKWSWM